MPVPVDQIVSQRKLLAAPWSRLPQRMRLLVVAGSTRTLEWVQRGFQGDAACDVQIVEAIGMAAGIECLRDQLFDAILIADHSPQFDALDLVSGLRAGGAEEPIVLLGREREDEMLALALEAGADSYLSLETTTVRALLWTLARGIERHALVRENRRLQQLEERWTEQEQRETQHLLYEQRAIVDELESLREAPPGRDGRHVLPAAAQSAAPVSPALFDAYRELLRGYVIMGAGNLSAEMERFAGLLATSGLSARETLQLHLQAVEGLVEGLHSRSTRHVMTRADLLILEVMVHLAEWYRRRYDQAAS
jgi:DNA-binding NarL/FixJ family response regulator